MINSSNSLTKYLFLLSKNIEIITTLRNELQRSVVGDVMKKKGYYALTDIELIETINLLIENTEVVHLLTKNGLAFQATSILRNSTEILIRVALQVVHYQWVKFEPSKREGFNLANKAEIIQFLQQNGIKDGIENMAFSFLIEMFPDKENPFFNLVNQLQKVYGELCAYSHPERQLQSRFDGAIKDFKKNEDGSIEFTAALIGGSRKKVYEQDVANFVYIFELNALAVRLIVELFRGVITDDSHIKNIEKVHKSLYEFNRQVGVEDWKEKIEEYKNKTGAKRFLTMRLKESSYVWPKKITEINIFNRLCLLWPRTEEDMPAIIIPCLGDSKEEEILAMRLLSALSWVHDAGINHEGFWSSGNGVSSCKRNVSHHQEYRSFFVHEFLIDEYDYLPLPEDEKTQLALALYREGQCLDNESYKFLSFFKILNINLNGPQQIEWINKNIEKIRDHQAKKALEEIKSNNLNVGEHLYTSGRCAVSHALAQPIVNPDNPQDLRRLNKGLPVIKALAELMIEQEFKVQSSHTVYKKHLYELSGFKKKIGNDLLSAFLERNSDQDLEKILLSIESCLPVVSIRLRGCEIKPFENLKAKIAGYDDKKILLSCHSQNFPVQAFVGLSFAEERLEFYLSDGFFAEDDGTAEMAKIIADIIRFRGNLLGNGVFEVWEHNGGLLGRKDGYIPVNIDPSRTGDNWNKIADKYDQLSIDRKLKKSPEKD